MTPGRARLFAALEATWPPLRRFSCGPFTLRDGDGGGQRVSAATVDGMFTDADLERSISAMADLGQPAIFQIGPGAGGLDDSLDRRGWAVHDPVTVYLGSTADLAVTGKAAGTVAKVWPPDAMQRELWAEGHIGPARLRVMERADLPKTTFLGQSGDRAAATAFVAVSDGIAVLHALHVGPDHRRQGLGRQLLRAAAHWAQENGAHSLALAVTRGNAPANQLYKALDMQVADRYHYRIPHRGLV